MDQALQDRLNQYFGALDGPNPQRLDILNNTYNGNFANGGYAQSIGNQQFGKAILNYSNPNPTGQPIYLGGGDQNEAAAWQGGKVGGALNGATTITPDNPYYSYFNNIMQTNPGAVIGTNQLNSNAGSPDISNPASLWARAHNTAGGIPNQNDTSSVSQALPYYNAELDKGIADTTDKYNKYVNDMAKQAPLFAQLVKGGFMAGAGALTGGFGSALGAASGLAGGATIGAGLGGALGSAITAPLSGQSPTALGALEGFGGAVGSSLLGQAFPETMASINPFGSSDNAGFINGSSGDVGSGNYSMGGNSLGGQSAIGAANMFSPSIPLNMGNTASNSVQLPSGSSSSNGFLDDLFSGSSSSNVSGTGGSSNPSGTNSPSLFDKAGSFLSDPSNLLGLGVAGAGLVGGLSGLSSGSSPTSSLGANLSSFTPQYQPTMGAPQSLANYTNSAMSPDQTLSGIATKGVYGGGNGPDEEKYFLNLVNNRLVDPSGHVASDTSGLNSVENSYLAQLGLGGYQNPTDLLRGISNFKY